MLQAFSELEGTEIGVFRTAAEAAEWLSVPEKSVGAPSLGAQDVQESD